MIKFKPSEDNRQFISIVITDGTDTKNIFDYIFDVYSTIKENLYRMDNDEILLNLENDVNYGFSLNALRSTIAEIAKANIYTFCVDMNEPTQRYAG